jgi:FKBP-type peptidyl-prolyl cis-trans isomerase
MRHTILAVAVLALAAGCKKADEGTPHVPPPRDPNAVAAAPAAAAAGPDTTTMTRLPSGIFYKDLTTGTGPSARAGQRVGVHYVGTLTNGTQFDANRPGQPPMEFVLAAGQMIAGFDQGVTGMKVGGKRLVYVPPALGYGAAGNGPVPPNAVMLFTIDLVTIQ